MKSKDCLKVCLCFTMKSKDPFYAHVVISYNIIYIVEKKIFGKEKLWGQAL